MIRPIEDLARDWRRVDERIEGLSTDIVNVFAQDPACEPLMTVPGIGPIISSAMVAAIGTADADQIDDPDDCQSGGQRSAGATALRSCGALCSRNRSRKPRDSGRLKSCFLRTASLCCLYEASEVTASVGTSLRGLRPERLRSASASDRAGWKCDLRTPG
jgi:transposase